MPRFNALSGTAEPASAPAAKTGRARPKKRTLPVAKLPSGTAAKPALIPIPVAMIAQMLKTGDRALAERTAAEFEAYRLTHPALVDWRDAWRHFCATEAERNTAPVEPPPSNVIAFPPPQQQRSASAAEDFLRSL